MDRFVQRLALGVPERDFERGDDVPGGALQRPVVAKRTQVPHPGSDVEPFLARDLRSTEVHDGLEDLGRENREVAFTEPRHAVVERHFYHADRALGTVREAFLDLRIVRVGIGRGQEQAADIGDRWHH